jgi:bacterioferritin (cytochrome b1)
MKKTFYRLMESNDGTDGDTARPNPTEINKRQNNSRLSRMQSIADRVDGGRAEDFQDVDGETVTGDFQGGEFDDSPEAREAQALREEEEARVALEEEATRAEAENLQAEGAAEGESEDRTEPAGDGGDAPEEKLINGVKHYLVLTPKGEKWLTFPQLKASAQKVESADEALQRANDAVKKATQLALAPREEPNDEESDLDVESILSSAVMGDREAIKSLASLLKTRPSKTPDVSREVAQAIATRSAVQTAELQQKDIFEVEPLVPVFRARLTQVAQAEPELSIVAAYKKAGDMVRKEFAPMLKRSPTQLSKADRKRTLVNPPAQGSRQAPRADEDGEENPTSVIDQIAKGRGQARAIRHGRNLSSS